VEEEVQTWKNRALAEENYAIYLDCTFISVSRGKAAKEPL